MRSLSYQTCSLAIRGALEGRDGNKANGSQQDGRHLQQSRRESVHSSRDPCVGAPADIPSLAVQIRPTSVVKVLSSHSNCP